MNEKIESFLTEEAKQELASLKPAVDYLEKIVKLKKELGHVQDNWTDLQIRIRCAELASKMKDGAGSFQPGTHVKAAQALYDFITTKEAK